MRCRALICVSCRADLMCDIGYSLLLDCAHVVNVAAWCCVSSCSAMILVFVVCGAIVMFDIWRDGCDRIPIGLIILCLMIACCD